MNINTAFDKFLLSCTGIVSPVTVERYRQSLKPLLERFGEMEISEMTVDDLRGLYVELSQKDKERYRKLPDVNPSGNPNAPISNQVETKYSVYTLHGFARSWKRFFKWCHEEEIIAKNPARRLRLPLLPDPDPKAISHEDVEKLINATHLTYDPLRNEAIVRFLADTGARVGGTAGLRLQHLNLKKRHAKLYEKGRGGNKKINNVYFTPKTAVVLAKWLSIRSDSDDERVFLLGEYGIYQVLQQLAEIAEVSGPHNPHAFRHGFALGLLEKGANLAQVSQLLNHSDSTVTTKFYGKFPDPTLQKFHLRYSWMNNEELTDEEVKILGEDYDKIIGDTSETQLPAKEIRQEWVSIPEAMKLAAKEHSIRVPDNTIICSIKKGRFPNATRIGRDWLLPKAEFICWLKHFYHPRTTLTN